MALGNGNPKEGDKGSNFNYELKALQGLESIAKKLETGIVKKIVAGTGITISPTTGVGNVTINASATGPTTLTFGGTFSYTVGSEPSAFNAITTLTQIYTVPGPVLASVGRNYWFDISIQTGNYAGPPYPTSNFTVSIYASTNGLALSQLLGTYTVPVTTANTVYKMQRTFFTGSTYDVDAGSETFYVYGLNPSTNSNSDGLTSAFVYTSIGTNSIQYPYIVIAAQAGATGIYRLGPSRITYQ